MNRFRGLLVRILGLLTRHDLEREMSEELESHLEIHIEDHL